MGDWYAIGITLGLGIAAGLLLAGLVAVWKPSIVGSAIGAVAVGIVAGLLVKGWIGLPGGIVGALVGAVSASLVLRGALRRGATAGGLLVILAVSALVVVALSFVPVVGYVLVVVVPVLAVRRARNEPERFAGLRTLSK